jgi:hypothetical protein
MCARRPTPQSYTCRTPSRVFTLQALLNYALDCVRSSSPPGMYTFLSCIFRVDYLALGFRQQHQRAAAVFEILYQLTSKLNHLTTGACALSSSEVCINLARTFHSGAHSEENELYNENITLLTITRQIIWTQYVVILCE